MADTDRSIQGNNVGRLFEAFARGDLDTFLAGSTGGLLITVWGTSPGSTLVPRDRLHSWCEALNAMTNGTLRIEVVLGIDFAREHLVILRHVFEIDGAIRQYDSVNLCTFRGGKLAGWFAYPMDLQEYATAWGTSLHKAPQLV